MKEKWRPEEPGFFQYARAFLCTLSLARQTNSFCLNVAWAINISYLVFISKSSSMKILQDYKHHVYSYSFSVVRHFVENVTWPGPKRVSKCQIFI